MRELINFIHANSHLCFRTNAEAVLFDHSGFNLSDAASEAYDQIKHQPHLYVIHRPSETGCYIGKSFQPGGRMRRNRYYHLGGLAKSILGDECAGGQNHNHWIASWTEDRPILQMTDDGQYAIRLAEPVYVSFVPFRLYGPHVGWQGLARPVIKEINRAAEIALIGTFRLHGWQLLNIHHNR
jgi:hypothetical protein